MADHARAEQAAIEATGARHRRQYAAVFALLGVLTLVELGLASTSGVPRVGAIVAFAAIAVAKAALIALFYMHLRFETRILRLTVLVPLVAPAAYGVILMVEAGVRALR